MKHGEDVKTAVRQALKEREGYYLSTGQKIGAAIIGGFTIADFILQMTGHGGTR